MTDRTPHADKKDLQPRERRCIVTGEMRPADAMVRFVVGPDGYAVPDIAAALPGRGLWVTASREILRCAASGNVFSKAAKASVKVSGDLPDRVEALIRARMLADLGLARKAGQIILGFDSISNAFERGKTGLILIEAMEAAEDGRKKLLSAAAGHGMTIRVLEGLSSHEMGLALGRENVIHAAVKPGPLANRLILDGARLKGLRASEADGMAGAKPACNERSA